jgi:hypothetical protein
MTRNEEFCKLAGISLEHQWIISGVTARCSCGEVIDSVSIDFADPHKIPDYAHDPLAVLRVMRKKLGFGNFLYSLYDDVGLTHEDRLFFVLYNLIPIKYLDDTTGKLLDAAIEWMRERNEKP